MFEDTAVEIFIDGFRDNFTEEAEGFFVFIGVNIEIILEMKIDDFIERRFFGISSFIDFALHEDRGEQKQCRKRRG